MAIRQQGPWVLKEDGLAVWCRHARPPDGGKLNRYIESFPEHELPAAAAERTAMMRLDPAIIEIENAQD
jgi:hypothetical protein